MSSENSSVSSVTNVADFSSPADDDSIDYLFSISNDSSDKETLKKKRRKRYVVNLFPRIVKSDIRRFYPRMLANISNSCNPQLVKSFMETYCVPRFQSLDVLPSEVAVRVPDVRSMISMEGLHAAIVLYILQFELMTDSCFILKGSTIKQFRDDPDRSELNISMEFRGTKVYNLIKTESNENNSEESALCKLAEDMDSFLNAFRFLSSSIQEAPFSTNSMITSPCNSIPSKRKILSPQPFTISNCFNFRIILDSNNRFCVLESRYE